MLYLREVAPKHYVLHRIVKIEGAPCDSSCAATKLEEHCKIEDVKGFVVGLSQRNNETG